MKKNVVITGGAKGIGKCCAERFLNNSYNVIVIDKILKRNIDKELKRNVDYYCCDISIESEVRKCLLEIKEKYNKIDILINDAGIQISSPFEKYDMKSWQQIINTNYFGTCNVIYNAYKIMGRYSTILNILSVHSNKPRVNKYAYDSSKSALEILTKELALEFANNCITINALSFGAVNTDMNEEWKKNPQNKDLALSKVPLKIIFEPEQIANFCYTIINEFSSYTTGSIFTIDGGRSLF